MSDPTDPVPTPTPPEPEKMIPLSAVAPLLGWARTEVLAGHANRRLLVVYDHAAQSIGMDTSAEMHASDNASDLKGYGAIPANVIAFRMGCG